MSSRRLVALAACCAMTLASARATADDTRKRDKMSRGVSAVHTEPCALSADDQYSASAIGRISAAAE